MGTDRDIAPGKARGRRGERERERERERTGNAVWFHIWLIQECIQ